MNIELAKDELVLLIQLLNRDAANKQQETQKPTPFEAALLVRLTDAFNERTK
jgi:hypothetical protein